MLLSYGKNFSLLTDLFIEYFPLYNKFRAVSSIQVILELCIPLVAVLGLSNLITKKLDNSYINDLLKTLAVFCAIIFFLFLFKGSMTFSGVNDLNINPSILEIIKKDRMEIYIDDLFRASIFVLLTFTFIFIYLKNKIKSDLLIIGLTFLVLIDLIPFNKKYVNNSNFINSDLVDKPYSLDELNSKILSDKSYFRVLDLTSSSTKVSYFHNSITGYHAAKLSSYNEILDFYINNTHMSTLNMLNTKYIIFTNQEGDSQLYVNDSVNGPAWFVDSVINVGSKDLEIIALDTLNNKNKAISTKLKSEEYVIDKDSYINLLEVKPNKITYEYNTNEDGFIVFSEIFYPYGWKSFIDGEKIEHFNVNYILRGMNVKSGNHTIEFVFDPDIVKKGSLISLSGSILMLLIISGMLYKFFTKNEN